MDGSGDGGGLAGRRRRVQRSIARCPAANLPLTWVSCFNGPALPPLGCRLPIPRPSSQMGRCSPRSGLSRSLHRTPSCRPAASPPPRRPPVSLRGSSRPSAPHLRGLPPPPFEQASTAALRRALAALRGSEQARRARAGHRPPHRPPLALSGRPPRRRVAA